MNKIGRVLAVYILVVVATGAGNCRYILLFIGINKTSINSDQDNFIGDFIDIINCNL